MIVVSFVIAFKVRNQKVLFDLTCKDLRRFYCVLTLFSENVHVEEYVQGVFFSNCCFHGVQQECLYLCIKRCI